MNDTTNIYQALLAAQKAMPAIGKNAINPHFKFAYADLGQVLNTITPALHEYGLLVVQRLDYDHESLAPVLLTEVFYAATGEKLASAIPIACKDPSDPQKVGGAITYYRRYSLLALLGLSPEDDDGNSAAQGPRPQDAIQRPPVAPGRAKSPAASGGVTIAEMYSDATVKAIIEDGYKLFERGEAAPGIYQHFKLQQTHLTDEQWARVKAAYQDIKQHIEARDAAIEARGKVLA